MKSLSIVAMVAAVCCFTVSCSRDKDAALLRQVRIGDTNAILSCLRGYTNINHLFSDESEPGAYASLLHAAVEYGHPEVVRILVEHRADIDVRDSRGRTPLMWVVGLTENDVDIATREQIMMLLLKAHATSDLSDKYGYTPLIWASMLGKTTLVRILLDAGAKVNLTDQNGESAS
jgi:ankyrin repeat protein